MGCRNSKKRQVSDIDIYSKHQIEFASLGLTGSHIRKIYKQFCKIDVDRSGSVDVDELLVYLNLPNTPFASKLFALFDTDNSGEVGFRECVLALWNYCSLPEQDLSALAFDLYDTDGSGLLSQAEVGRIIYDVYGKEKAVEDIEQLQGAVNLDAFKNFCRDHKLIMYPAFEIKRILQTHFLGILCWKQILEYRTLLCGGKYISLKGILEKRLPLRELTREHKDNCWSSRSSDIKMDKLSPLQQKKKHRKEVLQYRILETKRRHKREEKYAVDLHDDDDVEQCTVRQKSKRVSFIIKDTGF